MQHTHALVGDVGGTNARLALGELVTGTISRAKTYSGLAHPSLFMPAAIAPDETSMIWRFRSGVIRCSGCIAASGPSAGVSASFTSAISM